MTCQSIRSQALTRRRVIIAAAAALLPSACRPAPESASAPTPSAAPLVIGDPVLPPLLVAAPGGAELARPALVEFTRQNPRFLARWEEIGSNFAEVLQARLEAGTAPDVVRIREGQQGRWREAGHLTGFGAENLFEQLPQQLFAGARAAAFDPKGAAWGVPHYHDAMFLAYNRRHLDRLGGRPPSSIDELASFARQLQSQHSLRKPVSFNLAPKANANLPWWGLLKAVGASFAGSGSGDTTAVALLEGLRAMVADDGTLDPGIEGSGYYRLADGDCAFAIVGAYAGPRLQEKGAPIAFAPLPGLNSPAKRSVCWTPLFALANRAEPHPAAPRLAVHLGLTDKSGRLWSPRHFALVGNLPPAYPVLLADAEIRRHFGRWIDPQFLAATLAAAEPVEFLWEPWFLTWEHRCQELMENALFGRSEPGAVIASMRSEAKRLRESAG